MKLRLLSPLFVSKISRSASTLKALIGLSALTFLTPHYARAGGGDLVINSMHSDPTSKKAFETVLADFKKEHQNIKVTVNTIDHESYKVQIRTWLPNNPPDVATWFAGNRAKFFVDKKLVEPLDDVFNAAQGQFSKGALSAISFDGKKYLMPTNYYHWGFYYRKDLFQKAGITSTPKSWDEFLAASQKLKAAGLIPVAIGTKQAWPSAAWFDFINMRVNGYDFHMKLLSGRASYTSPEVKKTMAAWAQLVKVGAFPETAPAMTWQEASALLWQGKAAMYLMGNFIASEIPSSVKAQVDFFPFPTIDPKIPTAQVAPTDVFFIPAKARNKSNAKLFISFLARPDVQQKYNAVTGLLPVNAQAKIDSSNIFLKSGQQILTQASGLSQFFDRDADPEVAKVGMDGFVEFMRYPERTDAILSRLENTRKRVYR
jgi:multiple sugar transport system substrate-binding protein